MENQMFKVCLLCASEPDMLKMETIQCDHAVLKNVPSINIKLFCLPEMLTRKINNRDIQEYFKIEFETIRKNKRQK